MTDDCIPIANSKKAICHELWVQRNSIYDAAGYCFKTNKAIDYFEQINCRNSKNPSRSEMKKVHRIISQEKACGCR